MFRKQFHAEIDTDNITESFNHTLRTRYLPLQQDKTVSAFAKVLIDIVFEEQQREYVIATAHQSTSYRLPRYHLPENLKNRPRSVQATILLNMERADEITRENITEIKEGTYCVRHANSKEYTVNIPDGQCSCHQFITTHHPCKHMFAIFKYFTQWSWSSLPHSLTESEYLTLDNSVHEIETTELNISKGWNLHIMYASCNV